MPKSQALHRTTAPASGLRNSVFASREELPANHANQRECFRGRAFLTYSRKFAFIRGQKTLLLVVNGSRGRFLTVFAHITFRDGAALAVSRDDHFAIPD